MSNMFNSILYPEDIKKDQKNIHNFSTSEPCCFKDLNLDQVFNPIIDNEKEYDIAQYFYTPVQDINTVLYRQEIQKDLDNRAIFSLYDHFSRSIFKISRDMKNYAAEYKSNKTTDLLISKGHMLSYAEQYVNEIQDLLENVKSLDIKSKGLLGFNNYLADYVKTEELNNFINDTRKIRAVFDEKEYCLFIKNGNIKVLKYNKEKDNCDEARSLFANFIDPDSKDYLQDFPDRPHSEHIENKILTLLEKVYPKEFHLLDKFFSSYLDFVNDTIYRFAREMRFYISWKNFTSTLEDKGLSFCYPLASANKENIYGADFFDLALAIKLKGKVVVNSFELSKPERIIVITGPNQGGKTTFARSFGQLFYIAALGLTVPGKKANLTVSDKILTHFEREEKFTTQRGKLQDDIERLHSILEKATDKSVIIVNEIYASTTLTDALKLGNYMIDDITSLGAFAVVVTFMDELAEHGPETVSMMSNVKSENQDERTFKIIRRPPDGQAHALFIAEKYGLTYEQIKRRFQ